MAGKACSSLNLEKLAAELNITFLGIERLNLFPVYSCQTTLVCLDCGFAELRVPAAKLGELRMGLVRTHSIGS
jgi:hypothetical protein